MTGGTTTSTKQFVWCGNERCEVRDATSTLVDQYFPCGQVNVSGAVGTSYFYSKDHLGSVREMTDSTANVAAQLTYDPYGRTTQLQGSFAPDFQYAGYYAHQRSGLNLTLTRAYSAGIGRFISRDPIDENGGTNLYQYSANEPIDHFDPTGLFVSAVYLISKGIFVAVDATTGETIVVKDVFSGNGSLRNQPGLAELVPFNGPIPEGLYVIQPETSLPANRAIRGFPLAAANPGFRSGFFLHPGSRSFGCITLRGYSNPDFARLERLLNNTSRLFALPGYFSLRGRLGYTADTLKRALNIEQSGSVNPFPVGGNYDYLLGVVRVLP